MLLFAIHKDYHIQHMNKLYIIGVRLSEPHPYRTGGQNPLYIYNYIYILWVICIYEVLIIILLLNYIIIIIGRMLSHTSYAQRCLSGVSVASERKVHTSVQYRLPAIAISVASKCMVCIYISSVLPRTYLAVYEQLWNVLL